MWRGVCVYMCVCGGGGGSLGGPDEGKGLLFLILFSRSPFNNLGVV